MSPTEQGLPSQGPQVLADAPTPSSEQLSLNNDSGYPDEQHRVTRTVSHLALWHYNCNTTLSHP